MFNNTVTFVSFYSTELIVCAEEISDAYKHWKNEASYTNAFDYALFSGSETDSFVTNANSFKVVGDIHTNSSFVYRGNTIEVAGDIESSDYNTISVSDKDYKKKIGKVKDYSSYVIIPKITEDIKDEIMDDELKSEIKDAVQTFNYQVNTLQTSNGQSPFLSVCIYLNENPEYTKEVAMLAEEFFKQRLDGMKNKFGIKSTQTFPYRLGA